MNSQSMVDYSIPEDFLSTDIFRGIIEISSEAIWTINLKTEETIWLASKEHRRKLGIDRLVNPFIWREQIHPQDQNRATDGYLESLSNKNVFLFEHEYRFKGPLGNYFYINDKMKFLRDSAGNAYRVVGVWRDCTQEREKQFAMANREFILNQSQHLARIGSWELTPENKQVFWSAEMFNIYGVEEAFDVTNCQEKLYDENSRQVLNLAFEKLHSLHEPVDQQLSFTTPLGYRKWIRLTAYPIVENDRLKRIIGLSYDITYQKESEELLKRSEEKFSSAFHNSPDLMVITREEDWAILDVNDRVTSVMGYEREEIVGHLSTEFTFFVNSEDRKKIFDAYNEFGTAEIEAPWKKKDGTVVQLLINISRIIINQKPHFISSIKDISGRKLAEEKFQKAFDLSPDMMMIFRENDRSLQEANNKVFAFLNYSRKEVIGADAYELIHWVNDDHREDFMKNYYEKGSAFCEAAFVRKDGYQFYGMINTVRILLNGENHMLTVVRDISDKQEYEQKLIRSEANLNATINNSNVMIWSVDTKYRIITFNKPFYEYMIKVNKKEVMAGSELLSLSVEAEAPFKKIWISRYDRALKGEMVKEVDEVWGGKFSYSLSPIVDQDCITGVNVFAEDITERLRQEEALSEANRKIGELKLLALRSMMNPHFIFNSLNSIQYFITKNDPENAINYLSKFSKLIRGILTHSAKNRISLSDELELLKHYINLELLRFQDKFIVDYHIDQTLDLKSIQVPSMLIQPLVENAIIHGLYNRKGKTNGVLKISIAQEGTDRILFTIEDNGIGRLAASKLKNKNFAMHQSLGIALTEERLKVMSGDSRTYYEVEDLLDGHTALGTRVKIWIPL